MEKEKDNIFDIIESNQKKNYDRLTKALNNIGVLVAAIAIICYFVFLFVYINGMHANFDLRRTLILTAITSGLGIMVSVSMRIQGIKWAEQLPENQAILDKFDKSKAAKEKKYHGDLYYWLTRLPLLVFGKVGTCTLSVLGVIYYIMQGTQDWSLMLVGLGNVCLMVATSLWACAGSYSYYNKQTIKQILHQMTDEELKEPIKETEVVEQPEIIEESNKGETITC